MQIENNESLRYKEYTGYVEVITHRNTTETERYNTYEKAIKSKIWQERIERLKTWNYIAASTPFIINGLIHLYSSLGNIEKLQFDDISLTTSAIAQGILTGLLLGKAFEANKDRKFAKAQRRQIIYQKRELDIQNQPLEITDANSGTIPANSDQEPNILDNKT